MPYRPIRQFRRTKGVHKLLYNHLGLPLSASEAAIRSLKFVWNPGQVRLRERLAAGLPDTEDDVTLEREGYQDLSAQPLDMIPTVLSSCSAAYDASVRDGTMGAAQAAGPKEFLISIIRDEEVFQHPGVMELALSQPILRLASKYLGSVPMLSGVRLWYTPPNSTAVDSQLFHCDREDERQLKVLVNITDTTRENGPFTVLPAASSERAKSAVGYSYKDYRLSDEQVWSTVDQSEAISLIGPRGSANCVDTSRCLHYGSRQNTEPRLLLMVQYTRYLAPNVTLPYWKPEHASSPMELNDMQRLALGLAPA